MRRHAGLLLLAVAPSVLVGGCSSDEDAVLEYAALGDSYTAAPLVPVTDRSSGCLRSDHNYPSLVAASRPDVVLTDVSCSGAATHHLVDEQGFDDGETVPPQLDALTKDTDLVTVGLGANDQDFALDWIYTCSRLGREDPQGSPCSDADREQVVTMEDRLAAMRTSLVEGLAQVRERAPEARVLVVGYPQIIPAQDTCPALPIAAGDYPWARRLNEALRDTVVAAADDAGVEVVDPWGVSAGHDICAADPWFNGRRTAPRRALAYHPFQAYERAVADLILEEL